MESRYSHGICGVSKNRFNFMHFVFEQELSKLWVPAQKMPELALYRLPAQKPEEWRDVNWRPTWNTSIDKSTKVMFPAGLEPATFRVLGERDNHYTTETW